MQFTTIKLPACAGCCAPQECEAATLQCRTRGGDLDLCGFAEFDPSSPPRFYRNRVVSGTMYIGRFPEATCVYNSGTTGIGGSVSSSGTSGGQTASIQAQVIALVVHSPTQLKATVQWTWNTSGVHRPNVGLNIGGASAANVVGESGGVKPNGTYTNDIILTLTSTPQTVTLWCNAWYAFSGNNRSPTDTTTYQWSLSVTIDSIRDDWDLEQEYDDDCVLQQLTDNTTRHHEAYGPFPLSGGGTPTTPPSSTGYGGTHVDESLSATTKTITGKDDCVADSPGWLKHSGTVTETLSDEYTEDDAIEKMQADQDFGSWETVGGGGCTSATDCCLAAWETRTGDSFLYSEAEFKVTKSGLLPSKTYEVQVEIYRRTFGSGTFTLFQTLTFSTTTDGAGNLSFEGDVPNEEGYESYAGSACAQYTP